MSQSLGCNYCMIFTVQGVHCQGDRKKGGCHESFDDSEAYWAHIHRKTGGCTNPANYFNFYRLEGDTVWRLKKEEGTPDRSHS